MRRFGHARMTRDLAEGVILRVDWDGVSGLGECVPRAYVTGETPATVFEAISRVVLDDVVARIRTSSLDEAVQDIAALELAVRTRQGDRPGLSAACCLELALLDVVCKRLNLPLVAVADPGRFALPTAPAGDRAPRHPLSRTLDASKTPERFFDEVPAGVASVAKVKVGLGREVDLERIRKVRMLGGPAVIVVADANMAWSLDEACDMVELLRPYAVSWYEEPLAQGALADYRQLRDRTGARVMLDESLCSFSDAEAAIAEGACDLFNVRLSKNGGFIASLRLAELAHGHGIGVQMGTHPGSHAILRAAEWSFVHAVPGLVAVEAVRSHVWFEDELVVERLEIDLDRSRLLPLAGPGLGVSLRIDALESITVQRADL